MLRFFNHHIALPTLLLAIVEACLFFVLLFTLTLFHIEESSIAETASHLDYFDLLLICVGFLGVLVAIGLYNRDAVYQLSTLLQRSVIFLFLLVFLGFAAWLIDDLTPTVNLSDYISLFALATALNFLVILVIRIAFVSFPKFDLFKRRVLVLGGGDLGERIVGFLDNEGASTLSQVGYLNIEDLAKDKAKAANDTSHIVKNLKQQAREQKADEIVVAAREWRGLPVWELLECKMAGITVTEYLSFWERETGQIDLEEVKPSWLALSDGFRVNPFRRFCKRLFDILVSLTLLIITLPLLLTTALFIKLESPGPVFYRQKRVGLDGNEFDVIKFRSMREDAEKSGVPQWATSSDPRVTRVGAFIRRSRIDEIPQIINVLMGHMSFVGPRPERPYFVADLEKQIPLYSLRRNVRPGITGWAQVNYPYGASTEDAKRKLAYDLYYVKNGGLFLDLVILMQTVRVVLSGEGAR